MGVLSGNTSGGSSAPSWRMLLGLLCLLLPSPAASAEELELRGYKMAGDSAKMRVVLNFDREPEARWLLLRAPHRLVIDLPKSKFGLDPRDLKPRGLVTGVRYGDAGEGASRLILSAKGPFEIEKLDIVANEDSTGYRLVADIRAASERKFEQLLAEQAETTGSTVAAGKADRLGDTPVRADRKFTVVLDAGHGGIDGGAEGINGTIEKSVTLDFAFELKKKIEKSGKYNVFLTREKDEFLRLDERVRLARQHGADLLISIHADTIRHKGIRGATVYTVSDKASDAEAEATADRENLSDQLAGIQIPEADHQVADILIDLIRRETHSFSIRFARSLLGELSTTTELINNPHRSAGFKVLQAPDVPSVLLELGYLSNAKDEAQLRNPKWRAKAADSIASAIEDFAAAKRGTGG